MRRHTHIYVECALDVELKKHKWAVLCDSYKSIAVPANRNSYNIKQYEPEILGQES